MKKENTDEKKIVGLKPNLQTQKYFIKVFFLIIALSISLLLGNNCLGFSLFENVNADKGKWEIIKTELTEVRRIGVKAHLLPDGNILIFGGTGIRINQNTVDVFDPKKNEIVKTIPIYTEKNFLSSSYYKTISLKNGDVYLVYNVMNKDSKKPYGDVVAKIFDSKTYTFHDVKAEDSITSFHELALIKDGNILIFSNSPNKSYIYNVKKDEYSIVNSPKYIWIGIIFYLKNGDFIVFRGKKRYLFKDYKFEEYKDELPTAFSTIQIDNENYLSLNAELDCTTGYIVNIKENKRIPVKNKINRTWGPNPYYPKLVLLDNKNVLILGIYADNQRKIKHKEYTTYLYNFEKNEFFKIPNPPLYINKDTSAVKLQNGDILFVGGQLEKKMEIYKYKH